MNGRWLLRLFWMLMGGGLVLLLSWATYPTMAQPPIPHPATEGDDCLSCHQSGVADAPRVAWDHLGRGNDDCLRCHETTGMSAANIPHTLEGRDNCLSCHREGSSGSPMLSGNHVDYTSDQCLQCHQPSPEPVAAITETTGIGGVTFPSGPGGGGGGNNCILCHQTVFADKMHPSFYERPAGDAEAGEGLFADNCAECHGEDGSTPVGANGLVINSEEYWSSHDDADILQAIAEGKPDADPPMPAFAKPLGGTLSWDEILDMTAFVRSWGALTPPAEMPSFGPRFSTDVVPILQEHCVACHSPAQKLGGWDASSYASVMESGDHAPVIVSGDPRNSLLVQKLVGTQTVGASMPITEFLPPDKIQVIIDWVWVGAPNN